MKATKKQLAKHYKCSCGQEYTSVYQAALTHREMKTIGAKKHKKNCFSLSAKTTECHCCSHDKDSIF